MRLDVAYPDFYREQAIGNAQLPSPLDTQTLFSNLARQLIDDHSRVKAIPDIKGQGVHQLVQLVQGGHPRMYMNCMLPEYRICHIPIGSSEWYRCASCSCAGLQGSRTKHSAPHEPSSLPDSLAMQSIADGMHSCPQF